MINVFLDNEGLILGFSIFACIFDFRWDKLSDFRECWRNINSISTICVFSRFYNPYIFRNFVASFDLSYDLILLKVFKLIISSIIIRIIIRLVIVIAHALFGFLLYNWFLSFVSRNNWPTLFLFFLYIFQFLISLRKSFSSQRLSLLWYLTDFSEMVFKSSKFSAINVASFDKKSQGQNVKRVLPLLTIVFPHIYEHTFLVCELLVLLHFIVDSQSRSSGFKKRLTRFLWHRNLWNFFFRCQIVDYLLSFPLCPDKTDFTDDFFFRYYWFIKVCVLHPPRSLLQYTSN